MTDGLLAGNEVGPNDGCFDGNNDGNTVGNADGISVGMFVGFFVGLMVGRVDGSFVVCIIIIGAVVGSSVNGAGTDEGQSPIHSNEADERTSTFPKSLQASFDKHFISQWPVPHLICISLPQEPSFEQITVTSVAVCALIVVPSEQASSVPHTTTQGLPALHFNTSSSQTSSSQQLLESFLFVIHIHNEHTSECR